MVWGSAASSVGDPGRRRAVHERHRVDRRGFGLSEGAVGSVLAAVGTALPETLLPLVAHPLGSRRRRGDRHRARSSARRSCSRRSPMVVIARGGRCHRRAEAGGRTDLAVRPRRAPAGPRLLPGDVLARGRRRACSTVKPVDYALVDRAGGRLRLLRPPALQRRRRGESGRPRRGGRSSRSTCGRCCVASKRSLRRGTPTRPSPAPFVQVGDRARADHRGRRAVHPRRSTDVGELGSTISPLAFSCWWRRSRRELPEVSTARDLGAPAGRTRLRSAT